MSSEELKTFLTSSSEVQDIIAERRDVNGDEAYNQLILKNSKNPKKWKRMRKYTVGGKTDEYFGRFTAVMTIDGSKDPIDLKGGAAREFWLEGTDHITILLVEKDGVIQHLEDLSD